MATIVTATAAAVVLVQQSSVPGITPQFWQVAGAGAPKLDSFYVASQQPDQFTTTGAFVPVHWDPSSLTGIRCPTPASNYEAGIWNPGLWTAVGHTVAQMCGGTIGVFLNSVDYPTETPGNLIMIDPKYAWSRPNNWLSDTASAIHVQLQLQVPFASSEQNTTPPLSSQAYIKPDTQWCDSNAHCLSVSPLAFGNGFTGSMSDNAVLNVANSGQVNVKTFFTHNDTVITLDQSSTTTQTLTWTGWRTFGYTLTYAGFRKAIALAQTAEPADIILDADPAKWTLQGAHINAEMSYLPGVYETSMGWSVQNWTVTWNGQ